MSTIKNVSYVMDVDIVNFQRKLNRAADLLEKQGKAAEQASKRTQQAIQEETGERNKQLGIIQKLQKQQQGLINRRESAKDVKEIRSINKELQKVENQLVQVQSTGKRGMFGNMLQQAKTQFGALGLGVGFGLLTADIVNTGKEFEATMSQVKAITQATDAEFEQLAAQAKELGATTQFSASQAAGAMSNFAMAGRTTNEILQLMPGALDLAAAGQMDLAHAVEVSNSVLAGYSLGVEESAHVNDVLAMSAISAKTTIAEMGEGFRDIGPVASSAGIEIESTAAALATLQNAGIPAAMAGTSLRNVLTQLLIPTSKANKELTAMGVNFTDAEGNLVGFAELIEEFEEKGVDTAKVLELFGARGAQLGVLLGQGSDAVREMTERLQESSDAFEGAGATAALAEQQQDNLQGSINGLNSALEGLKIAVFEAIKGPLRGLVDILADVATAFIAVIGFIVNLPQFIKENKVQFMALGAAIVTLNAGLIANRAAIIGLTAVQKFWLIATKAQIVAQRVLNAVMRANPIGLVITGVLALVAAIELFSRVGGSATRNQELFSKATREAAEAASDELLAVQKLFTELDNAAGSLEILNAENRERVEILNDINEQYGEYLPFLLDERDSIEVLNAAYKELRTNIFNAAVARAMAQKQEELAKEQIETQIELYELLDSRLDEQQSSYIKGLIDQQIELTNVFNRLDTLNAKHGELGERIDRERELQAQLNAELNEGDAEQQARTARLIKQSEERIKQFEKEQETTTDAIATVRAQANVENEEALANRINRLRGQLQDAIQENEGLLTFGGRLLGSVFGGEGTTRGNVNDLIKIINELATTSSRYSDVADGMVEAFESQTKSTKANTVATGANTAARAKAREVLEADTKALEDNIQALRRQRKELEEREVNVDGTQAAQKLAELMLELDAANAKAEQIEQETTDAFIKEYNKRVLELDKALDESKITQIEYNNFIRQLNEEYVAEQSRIIKLGQEQAYQAELTGYTRRRTLANQLIRESENSIAAQQRASDEARLAMLINDFNSAEDDLRFAANQLQRAGERSLENLDISDGREALEEAVQAMRAAADQRIMVMDVEFQARKEAMDRNYDELVAEIEKGERELTAKQQELAAARDSLESMRTGGASAREIELEERRIAVLERELAMFKAQQDAMLAKEKATLDERQQVIQEYADKREKTLRDSSTEIAEQEEEDAAKVRAAWLEKFNLWADTVGAIAGEAINAARSVLQANLNLVDDLISKQEDRVQQARERAIENQEQGAVEQLELEQERLDKLNAEREKFVRKQQALATIELIINTTVAIAKAAAAGGPAAPFTIAATLASLAAGLIAARALGQQSIQGFDTGGYTGDSGITLGDNTPPINQWQSVNKKDGVAGVVHKGEFVFTKEQTKKYRPIFEAVHSGKLDLNKALNQPESLSSKLAALQLHFNPKLAAVMAAPVSRGTDPQILEALHSLERAVRSTKPGSIYLNGKVVAEQVTREQEKAKRARKR